MKVHRLRPRILVTGGAGFLGSHVAEELRTRGYSVKIFDIWANPMQDIRNPWAVLEAVKDVDAVMHLAAEPYIPYGGQDPTLFVETNINGSLNVLNACVQRDLRILVWSSSEVYGTSKTDKMDEDHPTLPHSTYAVTKLAADRLAFTFHKEHKLPVTILRQFNCYGPNETQPYVIPEIIQQLSRYRTIHLGRIDVERDFTYAPDAARAAVDLLECEEAIGEVVNVGTGQTHSIKSIAELLWDIMAQGDVEIHSEEPDRMRPYDVDRLLCNPGKMHSLIGWTPKGDLRDGLEETVAWYREHGWTFRHGRGD